MTQHSHAGVHIAVHTGHDHGHRLEEDLAQMLDLDAELSGSALDEMTAWIAEQVVAEPRMVVDLGAGTGTGSLALARRFPAAQVVAVDRSAVMLDRVRAAARGQGLEGRVQVVQADLDVAWPAVRAADLVWASSFLHEVADPGAVLAEVRDALRPGGLVVVVELDTLPRFLPDDIGLGRPGLESRCHRALADAGWNAHPDWRPLLEHAGFEVLAPRTVSTGASPSPSVTARYAAAWFARMRPALQDRLTAEDLDVLDRLLAHDAPEALLNRRDLGFRGSRTAWAARRP
jgi:SAM-dependent methyltransferase